jgi:hypothetical protein
MRGLGFCDENGKLISAVRMAKMPEAHKASLKKLLRRNWTWRCHCGRTCAW